MVPRCADVARPIERASADPNEGRVLVTVAQVMLFTAEALGIDRFEVLAEAELDPRRIADADGYLTVREHARLGRAIVTRRPAQSISLITARIIHPGVMGTLGQVVRHSATLRDALLAGCRYHGLLVSPSTTTLTADRSGAALHVVLPPLLVEIGVAVEAFLAMWVSIGRQLTGHHWVPQRVCLQHNVSAYRSELEEFFGCEVEGRAPTSVLRFDRAALALPILGARPDRRALFVAHVEAVLAEDHALRDAHAQVRAHIMQQLHRGPLRQGDVARALGTSERTLSRQLQGAGTTFGAILDASRRELALRYLGDATIPLHEVAFLLGYSEPSTFFRSFRRWTGRTPGEHRGDTTSLAR